MAAEMQRFQFTDANRPENYPAEDGNSGLFWRTKYNGTRVGHGGNDPGLQTEMLADLAGEVGVILFMNTSLSGPDQQRGVRRIFDALWKYAESLRAAGTQRSTSGSSSGRSLSILVLRLPVGGEVRGWIDRVPPGLRSSQCGAERSDDWLDDETVPTNEDSVGDFRKLQQHRTESGVEPAHVDTSRHPRRLSILGPHSTRFPSSSPHVWSSAAFDAPGVAMAASC